MVVVGEGGCKGGMRDRRAWKIGCCVVQVGEKEREKKKKIASKSHRIRHFIYLFIYSPIC